jgi:hypothetical protein
MLAEIRAPLPRSNRATCRLVRVTGDTHLTVAAKRERADVAELNMRRI